MGGDEGREVMRESVQDLWVTGRTWAFALSEVGAMEGSEQKQDMI